MSTPEQIARWVSAIRPEKQSKVLEFVEFLKEKERKTERYRLRHASPDSAMRGMEDEESLYSESDIRFSTWRSKSI